jgi:amphi-Trp domain-containing protein
MFLRQQKVTVTLGQRAWAFDHLETASELVRTYGHRFSGRAAQEATRRPPMAYPGDDMDLLDLDDTQHLRREEAATRLHALADALARNNSVDFMRAGRRITIRVPDEVSLKIEVEIGDENELEIELTW